MQSRMPESAAVVERVRCQQPRSHQAPRRPTTPHAQIELVVCGEPTTRALGSGRLGERPLVEVAIEPNGVFVTEGACFQASVAWDYDQEVVTRSPWDVMDGRGSTTLIETCSSPLAGLIQSSTANFTMTRSDSGA